MFTGRPMVEWTFEAASQAKKLDRIILSTDSDEIIKLAKKYPKIECPFKRPEHLAKYDTPHLDVIVHALDHLKDESNYVPEAVFTLQPTSPQRTASDIDSAIEVFLRDRPEALSSYQEGDCKNLFLLDKENNIMKPFVERTKRYMPRQSFPQAYRENGAILIQGTESIYKAYNNSDVKPVVSCLLANQVQPYITKSFTDIDTEADWEIVEKELLKTYGTPEMEIKGKQIKNKK